MAQLKNTTINNTESLKLPEGTLGQRPGSPNGKELRYNSDNGVVETYKTEWTGYTKETIKNGLLTEIDFSDPNSWRGNPTTNIVRNTNLNVGWSKGYQQNIVWNDVDPPAGVNSQVVRSDLSVNRNGGYWYSYGNYAVQEENALYSISVYVKTRDPGFRIAAYTADNNEAGRVVQRSISVPNDEEWYRVQWDPIYNRYGSQSDSLSFRLDYTSGGGNTNTRTWLCAPQMEKQSSATPFVPGGEAGNGTSTGSRGELPAEGSGVYDTSGNNQHARLISNPGWGYTYGGHLGLNGINSWMRWDGIRFDNQLTGENDSWTLSCWTSFTDIHSSGYNGVIMGATSYGGAGWYWTSNGSQIRAFGFMRSVNGIRYLPDVNPELGRVYNWVFVNDGPGNTISSYLDGEFVGSGTRLGEINRASNAGAIGIGNPQVLGGGSQQYDPFYGNIYQGSIYTRALSAAEIKQNYIALKGRFN